MQIKTVERRVGLSPQSFQTEFLKANKPVILTDFINDWPAKEKWSFDFFKEKITEIEGEHETAGA